MKKKAIIFDLDNTIYAVSSIAKDLFATLFKMLEESGELAHNINRVKQELMRKPFHVVAEKYRFSPDLTRRGIDLLENLSYEGPIAPFADYASTKTLPLEKYLVTSGFRCLQQSKIRRMELEQDFKEIHIVDVETSTKKEVFASILQRHGYQPADVLVVGDDPESELKAAQELGLDCVLYDKLNLHENESALPRITDYTALPAFL